MIIMNIIAITHPFLSVANFTSLTTMELGVMPELEGYSKMSFAIPETVTTVALVNIGVLSPTMVLNLTRLSLVLFQQTRLSSGCAYEFQ